MNVYTAAGGLPDLFFFFFVALSAELIVFCDFWSLHVRFVYVLLSVTCSVGKGVGGWEEGNNVLGLLFDATRSWCYALIHSLRNLLHALDATLWNILHGTCYTFLMLRFETLQKNRHCHVVDTRFSENRPSKIHRCLQKLLTSFWMTGPAQNQLSLHLWIKVQ